MKCTDFSHFGVHLESGLCPSCYSLNRNRWGKGRENAGGDEDGRGTNHNDIQLTQNQASVSPLPVCYTLK